MTKNSVEIILMKDEPGEIAFEEERVWEQGFDGHELCQLKRMARMPFSKKLEWLEEAHYLAISLHAAKKTPTIQATETDEPK